MFADLVLIVSQGLTDRCEVKRIGVARLAFQVLVDGPICAVECAPGVQSRIQELTDGVGVAVLLQIGECELLLLVFCCCHVSGESSAELWFRLVFVIYWKGVCCAGLDARERVRAGEGGMMNG